MSNPHRWKERAGHRRQPRARPRAGAGAGAGGRARRAGGARARRRWPRWWPTIRAAGGEAHAIVADVADRDAIARDRRPGRGGGRPDRRAGPQRQHAGADAAAAAARHRLRGSRARAGGEPGRAVPADQGDRRADGAARRRDDRARHLGRRDRGVRALGRVRRVEGGAGSARARSGRRSWPAPACASSTSTRARWTRACTPTRSPTPTARRSPIRRASRRAIVALLQARAGDPRRARASRSAAGPQAEASP